MNTEILENIRTLKRRLLPNDRLILYGSQARGNARPDSDWDLLLLLDKEASITQEEDTKYGYPFTRMGWDYGVYLSVFLYTVKEWEARKMSPFYINVKQDGIEIL
jgi:predicted nucleotidyltransferase